MPFFLCFFFSPAGVEARGGSKVNLRQCLVSRCSTSGVFVQAFSRACVSRCDVVGNAFAGVEAMRCDNGR